jgi:hypothetical protein
MVRGRLPGTVIGQVFRPGTSTPRDFPRYTGIIAKGLDIKLFRDAQIVRGDVEGEVLPFSGTTYIAPLANPAIPDKNRSRLYTSDGRTISATRWNFTESVSGSNIFDQVSIDPTIFSSGTSYLLDYVANDPALTDEVPVDDLREVLALGDNQGQIQYREGIDYRFLTTATGPTPDTGNLNPTQRTTTAITPDAGNTGTGTISFNIANSYTHDYNRAYRATVTAAAGVTPTRTATIRVDVFPTSSGSAWAPGRSVLQSNEILINLVEATPATLTAVSVEYGITLDFAFGATNFVAGATPDIFTWNGNGPGILELADPMLNTNQFPETTAVVATVLTGEGDLTVNPQTLYTGTANQPYEFECTAASGVGAARTATFRWRTTPKLKALSGTLTATNLSATVTGTGTQFASEVAAGDYLFIGTDPRPVQVLSVTNATTLVLTAVYPLVTQAGVKTLRLRESTGSVVVLVTAPTRVSIDQGIYCDFDFGPVTTDNFDTGDTFTFTANCARNQYNGKENRNYDITVTSTATPHQLTTSYAGSTALSGFGSHTFGEDNPLILSNNLVIHARNVTLSNRFDAVAPADTFDLSLTFDGLIDWTLEAENTETIATSDILRDLTGSITGTVGAYYILTRKVPTEVLYVRGPSPSFTNFTFSQVADTTVVYFTSNPGVNLTIKYHYKGAEPEAGATYFMTGYLKRPDSDYESAQVFFTQDAAKDFLAPMTPANDAAIANQIAWDQDELNLPGVVIFLVKDSDGDGTYTVADYDNAVDVSETYKGTMDITVVNQFDVREEFRDSVANMNDPTVARRRIGYFGFPTNYPIGDEFTSGSRVYVARRELQIYEESVARGSLAILGNSYGKKTIMVESLGNSDGIGAIPTQVTLDGSFLAVGLAARVSSFNEPWQTIYNLPISGFDEIEPLDERQMITLQDAGIICLRVEGDSAFYIGTMTTDETEPSTQQLSGTVQRQYVLNRLQDAVNRRVIGFVADSPEEAAQKLQGEVVAELGACVSEGKVARYVDEATGTARPLNPEKDVVAFRDRRDPTRAYFRASWYQKYPILNVDGLVAVDAPTP